jgi:hypothetical protein
MYDELNEDDSIDCSQSSQGSQSSQSSMNSQSSNRGKKSWKQIGPTFTDIEDFKRFTTTFMPYNIVRNSSSETYCAKSKEIGEVKHYALNERRECKPHKIYANGAVIEKVKCYVIYKTILCDDCKTYRILQDEDFEHSVECEDFIEPNDEVFHPEAHMIGITTDVKQIINDLIIKTNSNYT